MSLCSPSIFLFLHAQSCSMSQRAHCKQSFQLNKSIETYANEYDSDLLKVLRREGLEAGFAGCPCEIATQRIETKGNMLLCSKCWGRAGRHRNFGLRPSLAPSNSSSSTIRGYVRAFRKQKSKEDGPRRNEEDLRSGEEKVRRKKVRVAGLPNA